MESLQLIFTELIEQKRIIETILIIVAYFFIKRVLSKIIDRTIKSRDLIKHRGVLIKKVVNILLLVLGFIFTLLIWGVSQSDLAVFMGSVLTIVGVAFFAQWSLLSNITSSIILFFGHPIKIGDSIAILEGKEYIIEGQIVDIGIFFITLRTDEGESLTLPNNIFIQKSIRKRNEGTVKEEEES
ncbi:MAG: mechanosensitive ion channel domain-containing protein [Bacteroidota bacterium]